MVLSVPVTAQPRQEPPLLRKLLTGQPVTYLALGDSITYGMGVRDGARNCFPALFAHALSEQFDHPAIKLFNAGNPGVTVGTALKYAGDRLASAAPDLVTVQYGGNDSRVGTEPRTFRNEYTSLVQLAVHRAPRVVLCVPPLEDKFTDAEIAQTVFTTARRFRLPVADFETALKRDLPEFRGPFPWGDHPEEHAHAVMARELYRAFAASLNLPAGLSLGLRRGSWLLPAETAEAPVTIDCHGPASQPVTLRVRTEARTWTVTRRLSPQGETVASFSLSRTGTWAKATRTQRLWCSVRSVEEEARGGPPAYDFSVAWLSFTPVLSPAAETGIILTKSSTQTGAAADLAARVTARWVRQDLVITVAVTDDTLRVDNKGAPYENDCVELYLDTRSAPRQGAPYYSRGVALVFVVPAPGNPRITWVTKKPTPRSWARFAIDSGWRQGGYVVELRIPHEALLEEDGTPLPCLGFDVAVDDADTSRGRETQLVWAGSSRNYLSPAGFGGIDLRRGPPRPSVRMVLQ